MSVYFKSAAGVLAALIIMLCVSKYNKDISLIITLTVCAMVILSAMTFIKPVVDFMSKLQMIGNVDPELFSVVLKVVGIAITGEFSSLICKDAGNESMGKSLQLLTSCAALWMSIPVFERLLSLLDKVLSGL